MSAALCNFLAALTTVSSYLILAQGATSQDTVQVLMWALLPLVGAFSASMVAFFLNRISENHRAVAGRVIFALFFGVLIPRVLTWMHPWIKNALDDPLLVIGAGFFSGLFGYAAAVLVVDKMFKIAPGVVDQGAEKFAEAISMKVVEKTAAAVNPVAVEAARNKLAEDISVKVVGKSVAGLEPQVGQIIDDVAEAVSTKVVDKTQAHD